MKNLKKIVPVVLICSLCVFMLTGCFNPFSLFSGNKESKADAEAMKGTNADDPSKYVTQNTTATTPNTTTNNSNTQTQTTTPQQNTQTQTKEPVSLLGEWHLVAHIYGTRREPCEAVETANIYYTFYESGEYNLRNFNADEEGMYKREGNALSLKSDNGYSSVIGGLDGDELTVYDPATNINYVYKKN